jgi:lipopolysaccharide export system permease protein
MKILTRYIIKAVLGPLFFGIFAFTIMILGVTFINILSQFEQYHLSLLTNLKLLSLYIPQNLLYGSIIAVLLATILGLGTLTSHSETIAMRAGGLSFFRLAAPVLIIGLIISLFGIFLSEFITPYSYVVLDKMRNEITSTSAPGVIYRFSQNFYNPAGELDKIIYAAAFDPKAQQLNGVKIVEMAGGQISRTIEAETMNWNGKSWFFKKGRINQMSPENLYPIIVKQAKVNYPLNLTPAQIQQSQIPPEQRSLSDLNRLIKSLSPKSPEKVRYLIDLHGKFSMPFAGFILALLGIPLALRPQRRSNAAGFGLCLLFILIWWILYMFGTSMSRMGLISPFIGAWLANFVMAGYGIYAFTKVKI